MRLLYSGSKFVIPSIKDKKQLHVYDKSYANTSAYKIVSYLESNGTQYINTGFGFIPNKKIGFEVEYMFPTSENLLGFGHHRVAFGQTNGIAYVNSNTSNPSFKSSESFVNVKVEMSPTNTPNDTSIYTCYINDSEPFTWSWEQYDTNPYMLFAMAGWGGTLIHSYTNVRIKRCKMYIDDVLVKDLIPVVHKESNEPMMYDTINETEYHNDGTGIFIVGE